MIKETDYQIKLNAYSIPQLSEICSLIINHLKTQLKVDEDEAFKIELSLREAVNNAVAHGNKNNKEKRVFVNFGWDKDNIYIKIEDQGEETVDLNKISQENKKKDVLSYSGRGVNIIKAYMDNTEFISKEKGNIIYMSKKYREVK